MTRIAPRFLGFLLLSGLATSPALAQMYNAGDACPEPTPGRVFTQEGSAGPALVCNGTTLEVYESVLTGPLRKGIGTATPQATLDISSTDSVLFPRGTTAERPGTPINGMIRYNSTTNKFEAYQNSAWVDMIGGGSSLWTDNTTHISRSSLHVLNAGETMTSAGFDGGMGTGMVWYPDKQAFRVGYVNGFHPAWNESNIGGVSVAMGYQTQASGDFSTAMGINTTASGERSTAMGSETTASGTVSTAMGSSITAQGQYSVGIGLDTTSRTITANNTMAIMGGNVGIGTVSPAATLDISSTDSVLLPRGTTAQRPGTPVNGMIRYNSTTNKFEAYQNSAWVDMIGGGSSLWTDNTTHISRSSLHVLNAGETMTSAGFDGGMGTGMVWYPDKQAFRVGYVDGFHPAWNESNIGGVSVAMGYQTQASGNFSTAMGINTTASGSSSTAMGSATTASGTVSTAMGSSITAQGQYSVGIGLDTTSRTITANNTMAIMGGNVGIGTVSPAAKLDVAGEVKVGNTSLACSGTTEGAQRYNSTSHVMEYCNGTSWTPFAQVQSTPGPTAPAGSGYFVLTHTTWNGNLGGIAGADAKCLTELGTTYTSWRGYTTANSNGQITAGKVHAFLCDQNGTCNNLMPLTTYYFAYANSGTPGGASFTTDATGLGPNDSAMWSAANYFSGTYTYWMNREDNPGGGVTPTKWVNSEADGLDCSLWTSSSSGSGGNYGNSGTNDALRWWEGFAGCNITRRLICFVNP